MCHLIIRQVKFNRLSCFGFGEAGISISSGFFTSPFSTSTLSSLLSSDVTEWLSKSLFKGSVKTKVDRSTWSWLPQTIVIAPYFASFPRRTTKPTELRQRPKINSLIRIMTKNRNQIAKNIASWLILTKSLKFVWISAPALNNFHYSVISFKKLISKWRKFCELRIRCKISCRRGCDRLATVFYAAFFSYFIAIFRQIIKKYVKHQKSNLLLVFLVEFLSFLFSVWVWKIV